MAKTEQVLSFPAEETEFKMIDVGRKRPTRRRAVATGSIYMSADAFEKIRTGTLPKGNVLALAEAAGIAGAKNTPNLLIMCHPLPLDQVTIHCFLDDARHCVTVYCQAAAFAKTGVEMEALAGVNAALLTVWDLTKGVDPALRMGEISLLAKTGGKSGIWTHPDGIPEWLEKQLPSTRSLAGKSAAVLVMSDRAAKGEYTDESGAVMNALLEDEGAVLAAYEVIPDEKDKISAALLRICADKNPDVLIASGGTGPGPRDVTPDVLEEISDRMLDGLGDLLRFESLHYTDTAWLSRMTAGMVGSTLVIAFPGSPKAVKECWEIIVPFLRTALDKIAKQGF